MDDADRALHAMLLPELLAIAVLVALLAHSLFAGGAFLAGFSRPLRLGALVVLGTDLLAPHTWRIAGAGPTDGAGADLAVSRARRRCRPARRTVRGGRSPADAPVYESPPFPLPFPPPPSRISRTAAATSTCPAPR